MDDPPTHSFRPKNQYQHLFTPPTELLGNSPRLLLLQSRQAAEVPGSERLKPARVGMRRQLEHPAAEASSTALSISGSIHSFRWKERTGLPPVSCARGELSEFETPSDESASYQHACLLRRTITASYFPSKSSFGPWNDASHLGRPFRTALTHLLPCMTMLAVSALFFSRRFQRSLTIT